MKTKTPNKKIRDKLKTLCREIIIERDKSICQKCGKEIEGKNRHVSHVIPRSKSQRLEFDLNNLKLLCTRCHLHWWHKNPIEAGPWFIMKFPERVKYLEMIQLTDPRPLTVNEMELYYEKLKKEFK